MHTMKGALAVVTAVVAASLAACSGTTTTSATDASSLDGSPGMDSGQGDSTSGDTGRGDGTITDSAGDTGSGDTGTDAAADTGGTDTGTDASCGPCMPTFICCNGACINPNNDILNCGGCNRPCGGPNPYCDNGTCGTPPCSGLTCTGPELCCGTQCCMASQLCCIVPGPVGPSLPQCTTPVNGTCPTGCTGCVCAAPDTPIATPEGNRPIADLAPGDLVYSVDHDAIVAVPLLRVNRAPVHDHHVVRVELVNGTVLEVSPRHPTADGRTFGDLRAGGMLDRLLIRSVEMVPYVHPYTYDILPASETRTYFAGGALIGTTLPGP